MLNEAYVKRKKKVGGEVFGNFNEMIGNNHFKKEVHSEKISLAADLAEEMPFVTLPLVKNGILRKGENNAHILHVYQPNLWTQDYAYTVGELDKMTVSTAIERANASSEYVLKTSRNIKNVLKSRGVTEYDFVTAMRQASMIESAYYTRLGKGEMTETERRKIDSSLLRRTYRNISLFKTVVDAIGVNGEDRKELFDLSEDIELTEVLQVFVKEDPYFNRRASQIGSFESINSEKSASLRRLNVEGFIEEMVSRAIKNYPSVAKRLQSMLNSH